MGPWNSQPLWFFTTLALVKNLALQRKGIGTLIVHNLHLVYLKKKKKKKIKQKYITFNLYTTTQSLF